MRKTAAFLEMIKFEHTVFALPFAYSGYALGSGGYIIWEEIGWITVAMVAARTAGMCLNRLIDRAIDAKNPRTRTRALVTGEISPFQARLATLLSIALLLGSAAQLNDLCLTLSPLAVLMLTVYNYLKRFTPWCHFGIGAVLACAPLGGWIAATGTFDITPLWLAAAVLTWVAGFDMFYSLQDADFDKSQGLHSVAADFGPNRAVLMARILHLATLIFLVVLGIIEGLNGFYWAGLAISTVILAYEHFLMRGGRLQHIGPAFFTMNGVLSIVFFVFTLMSVRI